MVKFVCLFRYGMLLGTLIPGFVLAQSGSLPDPPKAGYVVETINVDSLRHAPVSNLSEILQGRVPGVSVAPTLGLNGEGARLRIRGTLSLTSPNDPLIYLDNIRLSEVSRLNDIDPDVVERIEIRKGAASGGLFGAQAANGIVQIFTKSGSVGKPKFSFKIDQAPVTYPDAYKPNAGFARNAIQLANMQQVFNDPNLQLYQLVQKNFTDGLFDAGHRQTYSLLVAGGSAGLAYFAGGRYHRIAGPYNPQPEDFFGRLPGGSDDLIRSAQFHGNLTFWPTGKLQIRLRSLYSDIRQEFPESGNSVYGPMTLALFGKPERVTPANPQGSAAFATLREATYIENKEGIKHTVAGISTSYDLTNEIKLAGTFGIDYVDQRHTHLYPFAWNVDGNTTPLVDGDLTVTDRERQEFTVEVKADWTRHFTSKLASTLVLGFQRFDTNEKMASGHASNFPGPGIEVIDAGAINESSTSSFDVVQYGGFVQEQIGYANYLHFIAGLRFDKFGTFGSGTKTKIYPQFNVSFVPSAAWNWSGAALSNLRLRGAIGRSAQNPNYASITIFVPFTSPDGPGLAPANLGSEFPAPEVAAEWELGFDAGLLNDRLRFEFTYWDRSVNDALVLRTLPPVGGFYRTSLANIGKLTAHGVELQANWVMIKRANLAIEVFAHSAFLREKVNDLGGAPAQKVGGAYPRYRNFIQAGYAPGAFFGAKLANADLPIDLNRDGKPESREALLAFFSQPRDPNTFFPLVVDENGDGNFLDHYLGKPTPDWQGAFGCNIRFLKRFRLSSLFEYKAGNYQIHNLTDEFRKSHATVGRNTPEAAATEMILLNPASTPEQRLTAAAKWAKKFAGLTPYDGLNAIEKGDFLRWRELSLTYELSSGILLLNNLALTITGHNLALLTGYSGIDPESDILGLDTNVQTSIDTFGLPVARQIIFSLRAGF